MSFTFLNILCDQDHRMLEPGVTIFAPPWYRWIGPTKIKTFCGEYSTIFLPLTRLSHANAYSRVTDPATPSRPQLLRSSPIYFTPTHTVI